MAPSRASAIGDTTGSASRMPTWTSARQDTPKSPRIHSALLLLLVVAAIGFGMLQYYARRLADAPIQPVEGLLPRVYVDATLSTQTGGGGAAPMTPASDDVRKALIWLAQKSLDDYRLVAPPNDNAYFYYSRLRDIDPESRLAEDGFRRIAERFAVLAEKEMARSDEKAARNYVTIGLQLDPNNEALRELRELTKPRAQGLLDTIIRALGGNDKNTS
jgi:hypothetical protein